AYCVYFFFFFSSRRRHTRFSRDWSSDVCSSDLVSTNLPTSVGRGLADEAPAGARDGLSVGRNRCFSVAFAQSGRATATGEVPQRSEERRVGKGGRCRVSWFQ